MTILGYPINLPESLLFLATPAAVFFINLLAWLVIALLANHVVMRLLRVLTRRLPGEVEDIILAIIRLPIIIIIALYGLVYSLHLLPLRPEIYTWVNKIFISVGVILITYVLGLLIRDIVVYYGTRWTLRTESQLDDLLIPILNLFSPLVLGLAAILIILPLWGINITSVLLGAGVLGLVLGLALQDTLSNIFSGLSLLIEAPFRISDLVLFDDGRICEVLRLGLRSTMLFSLDEQATIYMPNKILASSRLINLTKPTPEHRYAIEVTVDDPTRLAQITQLLIKVANGHPAVISSKIFDKCKDVREQVQHIRQSANKHPHGHTAANALALEADRNENAICKLEKEGQFNASILDLKESLRQLIRAISSRESQGLSKEERQELFNHFISPAELVVQKVIQQAREWSECQDPWVNSVDYWSQRKIWDSRNQQLLMVWERLKKTVQDSNDRMELRLDDATKRMLEWIEQEYKLPPGYWKDPSVAVKSIQGSKTILQVWYTVDNIRLEHDSRPQRVRAEISRIIQEKLAAREE